MGKYKPPIDAPFYGLSFWDKIWWYVIPQKCVLCGKWKLLGKTPHKKCEDYELGKGG